MAHVGSSRRLVQRRRRAKHFLALAALVIGFAVVSEPALSQVRSSNMLAFPARPKQPTPAWAAAHAPTLVQVNEMKNDYPNNTDAAVGNVQIFYGGATIEADQVIYDQKNKRLRASEMPGLRSKTAG